MAKTKKFAKPELKEAVEDFNAKVEGCHTRGVEDDEALQKATKLKKRRQGAKKAPPRADPENDPNARNVHRARSQAASKGRRGRGRHTIASSSEESSGEEEVAADDLTSPVVAKGRARGGAKGRGRRRVVVEDSDDDLMI